METERLARAAQATQWTVAATAGARVVTTVTTVLRGGMTLRALPEEMQPPVRNALRILIALVAERAAPARGVSLIPPAGVVREAIALAPRVVPVQILLLLV